MRYTGMVPACCNWCSSVSRLKYKRSFWWGQGGDGLAERLGKAAGLGN
jgi:hypothetical protein